MVPFQVIVEYFEVPLVNGKEDSHAILNLVVLPVNSCGTKESLTFLVYSIIFDVDIDSFKKVGKILSSSN